MARRIERRIAWHRLGCMALLVCVGGCRPAAPEVYEVTGLVQLKNGTPCDGALVVFHPTEESRVNDPKPVAKCDASGAFSLTTLSEGDGAAAGNYGVTVVWLGEAKESKMSLSSESSGGKDRLAGKYGQPQSPRIFADVQADVPNRFEFILD